MAFIQLEQLNVHYEQQENGSCPIIFLHGNFGSGHHWQPYLNDLPGGFCGYAPDFRGCGDSEVTDSGYDIPTLTQDILNFADRLELKQFHLVGHSLGGAVAQELAASIPERILSLTLVAPVPAEGMKKLAEKPTVKGFFSPKNIFQFLDTIGIKRKLLTAAFKKTMPGLQNQPAYLNMMIDDAMTMDIKAFSGFLDTLKAWQGSQLLKTFGFPVLIVYGDLDTVIPQQPLLDMQSQIKDCNFHLFRNIGHTPQLESPNEFNHLLTAFIQDKEMASMSIDNVTEARLGLVARLKQAISRIFKNS